MVGLLQRLKMSAFGTFMVKKCNDDEHLVQTIISQFIENVLIFNDDQILSCLVCSEMLFFVLGRLKHI